MSWKDCAKVDEDRNQERVTMILEILAQHETGVSAACIAKALGVKLKTANRWLTPLRERGLTDKHPEYGPCVAWTLPKNMHKTIRAYAAQRLAIIAEQEARKMRKRRENGEEARAEAWANRRFVHRVLDRTDVPREQFAAPASWFMPAIRVHAQHRRVDAE